MKKKGFTLVELLAVIAILAILVIVAMPNVLGMFNQAKSKTFVTEVQTYMDAAKTEFISASLTSTGARTFTNQVSGEKTLKMDGAEKQYYITLDTYGNFKEVVVWDENFCYEKAKAQAVTPVEDKDDVKEADLFVGKGTYDATNGAHCGSERIK